MRFSVGDMVRKVKGYRFDGVVVGAYYNTAGQPRYSVQVDASDARRKVEEMANACSFTEEMLVELSQMVSNCDGMIHIFAEDQLENRIYE